MVELTCFSSFEPAHTCSPPSEQSALHIQDENSENSSVFHDGTAWVDLFVQEMMNASGWDDIRGRTTRFLEAFKKNVPIHSMASKEVTSFIDLIVF